MNRFKKFIEKITADAMFLGPIMTLHVILNILCTPCKISKDIKKQQFK